MFPVELRTLEGSGVDDVSRRHHVVDIRGGVVVLFEPGQFPLSVESTRMKGVHAKVLLEERADLLSTELLGVLDGHLVPFPLRDPVIAKRTT